jgi:hypothetical protein
MGRTLSRRGVVHNPKRNIHTLNSLCAFLQTLAGDADNQGADSDGEGPLPQWTSLDFRETGISASDASLQGDERISELADHIETARRGTGEYSDLNTSMDSLGSSI